MARGFLKKSFFFLNFRAGSAALLSECFSAWGLISPFFSFCESSSRMRFPTVLGGESSDLSVPWMDPVPSFLHAAFWLDRGLYEFWAAAPGFGT